jgi:hypothetical protein
MRNAARRTAGKGETRSGDGFGFLNHFPFVICEFSGKRNQYCFF